MKPKHIIACIAALVLTGASVPAEAGHYYGRGGKQTYISGYRYDGTPVHTERYLVRRDPQGYPIWGYRSVVKPLRHPAPPRYYSPPPRALPHDPASCAPPHPRHHHHGRPGVVIRGSFRY